MEMMMIMMANNANAVKSTMKIVNEIPRPIAIKHKKQNILRLY